MSEKKIRDDMVINIGKVDKKWRLCTCCGNSATIRVGMVYSTNTASFFLCDSCAWDMKGMIEKQVIMDKVERVEQVASILDKAVSKLSSHSLFGGFLEDKGDSS